MLPEIPHPLISPTDSLALSQEVTEEEIRMALFQMRPWKAPGVDGFHAGFYQAFWGSVKDSLVEMVRGAFHSGEFAASINDTFLVFLPKVPCPESFKQFRPISLCTVVYKIITKVLVNRLRPMLNDLIAPFQASFIPGRQAADNIMVAQEIIHTIRRSKSKNGLMALKIDLEKAYDRVRWDFLQETLVYFGFPDSWVKFLMACVRSTSFAVLWNGEKTESFEPQRGLRQGDPISPYLFVLCMERLGHLIMSEVQRGSWKPVTLGKGGPSISHLFFAFDLFLFGRATENQAHRIRKVLDDFCASSGAKVNFEKSKFFISPHAASNNARNVSRILGMSSTRDLGKYLGVPLIHGRVTKSTYREIIEKVSSRLNGWKAQFLSLAGRSTLINSVTSAIPTYTMLTARLPNGVVHELDKLNRRFLWGGTESKRALHLVKWTDVCLPKRYGGLGMLWGTGYSDDG